MTFLLDTNVVSETRKRRPSPNVMEWFSSVPRASVYLSVLVIGELRHGAELIRRRDYQQSVALEGWLNSLLEASKDRILPVTLEIAEEWGRMSVPDKLPAVDGLLAATAKVHGMTLVTRDTGRLALHGVTVINPFEPVL